MVMSSTLMPGRPSGVSPGGSSRSIAASHLQPITDVAKPVSLSAASRAHSVVAAGDDDARHPHGERFGEGVLDEHAADVHDFPPSASGSPGSSRTG